jgi:hypothetical protein
MARRASTVSSTSEVTEINDELAQIYLSQLDSAEPEQQLAPKAITSNKRFIFRTRPRTVRQMSINIPGVPLIPVNKYSGKEEYRDHYVRRYNARYTEEERTLFDRVRDKVGHPYIVFTPVAKAHECFYETDDPEVAEFIREWVKREKDPYVYESTENMPLRSLYTDATFPNTEAGRRALYEHDLRHQKKELQVKE